MKNIINVSELQRNGIKQVKEVITEYGEAFILNQRNGDLLKIVDSNNPRLLINIIKNIKLLKKELKDKYNIKKIGIAGSYARGENTPGSDLDILIDYQTKDIKKLFEIEELISKKIKVKNIDLLSFDTVNAFALETIERDIIYV